MAVGALLAGRAAAADHVHGQVAARGRLLGRARVRLADRGLHLRVGRSPAGAVLRVTGRVFLAGARAQGPTLGSHAAAEEEDDETRGERDHTPVPDDARARPPADRRDRGRAGSRGRAGRRALRGPVRRPPRLRRVGPRMAPSRPSRTSRPATSAPTTTSMRRSRSSGRCSSAALGLFGEQLLAAARAGSAPARAQAVVVGSATLHSGHIGDYIAWWSAGASLIGGDMPARPALSGGARSLGCCAAAGLARRAASPAPRPRSARPRSSTRRRRAISVSCGYAEQIDRL